jgi:hypothetical protein
MAFELRNIREEDLPLIFPEVQDTTLSPSKMRRATRENYIGRRKDICKLTTAIDTSRQAFMIRGGVNTRIRLGYVYFRLGSGYGGYLRARLL